MDKEKQLLEIIQTMIGRNDIELETKRQDVEEWDSLAHVMIIAAMKEKMGISVSIEESEHIIKVKDFLKNE